MNRFWLFLLATSILCGCSQACDDNDRRCAARALETHPARKIDTWRAALSVPLENRIGAAPAQVLEYLRLDNIANGWTARPRAARPDAALLADLGAAFAEIPAEIRAHFGSRLLGLFLVEQLGGSGYTEAVLDAGGATVAAFVVFDSAVLAAQTANSWATWKERTPFRPGAAVLQARIEADAEDHRRSALRYILLHELGHVLSVGAGVHPPWHLRPKDAPNAQDYPFSRISWTTNFRADRYESRFDGDFPQRLRTVYYRGAQLSAQEMLPTYANLARTDFPTLYAATNPFDDFAESFASYVHVVRMGRPWEITIAQDGRVAYVFRSCWEEPRCAAKRRLLEQLLDRTPTDRQAALMPNSAK